MIKRLFYYFKFKKMLKERGLMDFAKWVLKTRHAGDSLFSCLVTSHELVKHWPLCLFGWHQRNYYIERYTSDTKKITDVAKKVNQFIDYWLKRKYQ